MSAQCERRPFGSDEDLREYVESELAIVRKIHPELRVDFGAREFTVIPRATALCWLIEQPCEAQAGVLRDRHYLMEAVLGDGQFIIWFGGLHGIDSAGASTRDVMLPAVHVPFSLVYRDIRPTHEAYSLGAVLRWMLDHAERAAGETDPLVYPMNGHLY